MRTLPMLGALAMLAGCAAPTPPPPALEAEAAGLLLDEPIVPLAGPVAVTHRGWGPFTRGCTKLTMVAEADATRRTQTQRHCVAIVARPLDGDRWRIEATSLDRGAAAFRVSFRRDAQGRVADWALSGTEVQAATGAERKALENEAAVLTGGPTTGRMVVRQGDSVTGQISPAGEVETLIGLRCTVDGESRLRGRRVVVAVCSGSGAAALRLPDGRRLPGRTDMVGPMAIDVETGLGIATSLLITLEVPIDQRRLVTRVRAESALDDELLSATAR